MYLQFTCDLDFLEIGRRLVPGVPDDDFDWDDENVYEWMYVDIPWVGFSLNVSREHGWADLDDDLLDKYEDDQAALQRFVKPGQIFVMGWNRETDERIEMLPDSLAQYIADRLSVEVFVYSLLHVPDGPKTEPSVIARPTRQ